LEILCVPSSNFFNQEPSGNPTEILNAIQHVRPGNNFQPAFTLFARADVNGQNRLSVYSWALSRCDPAVPTLNNPQMLYYTPLSQEDVRWNFEKILFDRQGQPFKRFAPTTEPFEIEEDIRYLIEN